MKSRSFLLPCCVHVATVGQLNSFFFWSFFVLNILLAAINKSCWHDSESEKASRSPFHGLARTAPCVTGWTFCSGCYKNIIYFFLLLVKRFVIQIEKFTYLVKVSLLSGCRLCTISLVFWAYERFFVFCGHLGSMASKKNKSISFTPCLLGADLWIGLFGELHN